MYHELSNRRGIFKISEELLEEFVNNEWYEEIFRHLVIVRAEFNFESRIFKYDAFSYKFDKIEKGYHAPEYTIKFRKIEDKIVYSFQRK